MSRLFCEHIKRQVLSLDGAWNFCTDKNDIGTAEGWEKGLKNHETVSVPSVWNEEKGLLDYEGATWYEKKFYSRGGTLRFCFGAVMTEADVWLDGEKLGYHYGGFTQFDFIVNHVSEGWHTLTLRVDNRFDEHSIPQQKVDWYHYGGIIRSVEVETLEGICILNKRLEYTLSEDLAKVSGHFVLECYNASDEARTEKINIKIGDKTVFDSELSIEGGATSELVTPEFTLEDISLWDMDSPKLYDVAINTESDDLFDRVGFRKIEVVGGKILLNKKAVELHGVNRHEEYPSFGFAFPQSRAKHDIDLIKELGCNTIRGSHYPNSQYFVDLLDECGMLFWSEIPIWGCGFSEEALGDEIVVNRGLEMHREMLKYYYDHPSIIIWGMHNEILTGTQNAYEMSKKYYNFLKKNGGNRIVTYASDKSFNDICFEFCDVISLNMYFGWYSGGMERWESFVEEFARHREKLGYGSKPIIFSEFGGGALYGFHDAECAKWSEEYQAKMLEHSLKIFHAHPEVVGMYIWQYADIRTCKEMGNDRARGFNNKGILNEHRRPKLAYYAVKNCYDNFK